jgi:hypothetical protein
MPNCTNCGATVSTGSYCANCAAINSQSTLKSASKSEMTSQVSTLPNKSSSDDMSVRLEKAMRRAELLGYAAAGLGVAILVALIGIAFL